MFYSNNQHHGIIRASLFAQICVRNPDYNEIVGIDSVIIKGDPSSPVPEPSTVLLLGVGLVGVGLLGRKIKK